MRLAVSIWNDRVSPVLDVAGRLLVASIHEGREQYRFEADITDFNITRTSQLLKHLEVETLICGAVSKTYLDALRDSGFCVIPEVSGPVGAVISAFIDGSLLHSQFFLPGRLNGAPEAEAQVTPAAPENGNHDGKTGTG